MGKKREKKKLVQKKETFLKREKKKIKRRKNNFKK